MIETLEISGLEFELRRSTRRKTLGLTVDRGGELVMHAPLDVSRDDLEEWARAKLLWVHRKLAVKRELESKVRSPEYVTGESFSYLGRRYRLKIVAKQGKPLNFSDEGFRLRADARGSALEYFRGWYLLTGARWISERVPTLARKLGALPTNTELRDLGFRWGSCSKKGEVFINWKLLQLPVRLADYVIAHEMAHITERHHGPEFWAAMSRAMPDWAKRQEELKLKAAEIYWCHPEMND
jgi:predicted metal-dependent hydrolase